LKLAEISIAKPRFAVAFQLTRECEHILRALDRRENLEVIRLPALPPSARRSSSLRTQRREGQFARYFSGAGMASIRMADVALTRTWIGRSPSLPLIAQRFIAKSSGARVLHAEFFEGHLGVVCAEPPSDDKDLAGLQEEFRAERITFSPVAQYRHLLVGLMDHNSKTLAMGLLETLDLKEGLAAVITPLRAVSAVRRIDFGLLRVQPNGRELGSVRSGSL
jgi:polynucleotide 5'-kinase involved in rRNA processing